MEVIATRPLTINGTTYQPGDLIRGLSADKAAQLVAQRRVTSTEARNTDYTVSRTFTIKGKQYSRGQRIKVTKLPADKLHQLLEHRYLEPATS
jgi:hypothetical protein